MVLARGGHRRLPTRRRKQSVLHSPFVQSIRTLLFGSPSEWYFATETLCFELRPVVPCICGSQRPYRYGLCVICYLQARGVNT
jgi:hypothetical protein